MNCIDLRREALAQPLRLGDQAREHMETCPACRAFVERQRELDARLYDALQVPAPDGLAERILVAHGIRRRRAPWIWGIAATIVAAVAISALVPAALSGRALAGEAIAHVHEEPQSFRLVSAHPPAMLASELGSQGVRLARTIGEVTYSTLCPMSTGKARHIVVNTPSGQVTLFLLPQDGTRRRRSLVESDGMTAITVPAARGNIAIVAKTREQALAVENALILS